LIKRWLGNEYTLRDGDRVKVVGLTMAGHGLVNLELEHSRLYKLEDGVKSYGPLYLTDRELAANIKPQVVH
jgi:hypothetical protein